MRILLLLALAACSHKGFIGPDDAGGDAALVDGALPDAASPDGASPDGGNAGDQSFQSGSRIKVRYVVSSDGAQQAVGFYDSQRSQNCSFTTASDAILRCMPDAYAVYGLTTFFADSACTQPLLAIQPCSLPATEARVAVPNGPQCPSETQVVTLGAQFTAATMYQKGTSTCTATPTTVYFASFAFFQAGATVAVTSFQDATTVTK